MTDSAKNPTILVQTGNEAVTPIAWLSEAEQSQILGESFVAEFAAYRTQCVEGWKALAAKAAEGLKANGPAYGFACPDGLAVEVIKGRKPASSIGVKFLAPEEAAKTTRPKAERTDLATKFANIGATLVKKDQSLKEAGIPEIPAALNRKQRKA